MEHDADRQILQRAGSFDSLLRTEASGALRADDPEVDGLLSSLAAEIKTAEPKESGRADTENQTPADGKGLRFSNAFLDALADRLALRIFDRAKGIDANAALGLK